MTTRNAESMGTYGSAWQAGGYSGAGNVAGLLGSLRGRSAVVCGNADGIFDDLGDAVGKLGDPAIFAVNDVGMFLPNCDHWVSLHSDNMGAWKAVRWLQQRGEREPQYHLPDRRPCAEYAWENLTPLMCLSGYFAMQLAWLMDANPIVLVGCPGSAGRRFFEAAPRKDFGYGSGAAGSEKGIQEQVTREMQRLPDFKSRVRSASGWTREFFGSL